jgi:hypothetical protein
LIVIDDPLATIPQRSGLGWIKHVLGSIDQ